MTNQMNSPLKTAIASSSAAPERAFNPHRAPNSARATALIDELLQRFFDYERRTGLRRRGRKQSDLETLRKAASALFSDLAVSIISEGSVPLHLSRSKKSSGVAPRYQTVERSETFRKMLDHLANPELALIGQEIGSASPDAPNRQTTIWPTQELVRVVNQHKPAPDEFCEYPFAETIQLKAPPRRRGRPGPLINYAETDQTRRYRQELLEINSRLMKSDIEYLGSQSVDISQRRLRRVFTRGSFKAGGRLFGGFWQPMNKKDRLDVLRLDGQEVVELDYGQIMPRLVYSLAGEIPQDRDLYRVRGFEEWRPGIKKVMSSMLFTTGPMKRFPQSTRSLFPKAVTITDVVGAIHASHPKIASFFTTEIGHRCQFLESEILVEVLRILGSMEIVALPIHDAILVPSPKADIARRVMLHTFKTKTGLDGVVDTIRRPATIVEQSLTA